MKVNIRKAKSGAKANMSGRAVNCTKDNGQMGTKMAMASGRASAVTAMLDSGRPINQMDLVSMFGATEMSTKENGKRAYVMDKEWTSFQLVILTWESTTGAKLKDMVSTDGQMETCTLVNSLMARNMDKGIGKRTMKSNPMNTQECTRLI